MLHLSADRKILIETQNAAAFKIANVTAAQNLGMADQRCLRPWSKSSQK